MPSPVSRPGRRIRYRGLSPPPRDVRARERGGDQSGFAVVKRTHGIEEVRRPSASSSGNANDERSTNESTGLFPRRAVSCCSLQPHIVVVAATFSSLQLAASVPSGLLIPRSQVRSLPGHELPGRQAKTVWLSQTAVPGRAGKRAYSVPIGRTPGRDARGTRPNARPISSPGRSAPRREENRMAFMFKLEAPDGTPAETPTLKSAVPNWRPGDAIPLGRSRGSRAHCCPQRARIPDPSPVFPANRTQTCPSRPPKDANHGPHGRTPREVDVTLANSSDANGLAWHNSATYLPHGALIRGRDCHAYGSVANRAADRVARPCNWSHG